MSERQHPGFLIPTTALVLVLACLATIARRSIDPPSLTTPSANMALILAGEFTVGSLTGHPDERPPHAVYLEAFYVDTYEVTNAQYLQFLQSANRQFMMPGRPSEILHIPPVVFTWWDSGAQEAHEPPSSPYR